MKAFGEALVKATLTRTDPPDLSKLFDALAEASKGGDDKGGDDKGGDKPDVKKK